MARSCWCSPGATSGYIEKKALLPEGMREQGRERVCAQNTHSRTKQRCLSWSGQRSRGERERVPTLPWNITYFTSS